MIFWISLIVIIGIILILSLRRLKLLRDPSREGADDRESILAYDRLGRGILFSFIRYLIFNQFNHYELKGQLIDAGCGPGYLDLALAKKYPDLKITGIDISPEMIKIAKKNLDGIQSESAVMFQIGDVQNLSFPDNSADWVISTLSLHHFPVADKALQEIFRVLKPGGQVFIGDLRRDEPLLLAFMVSIGQDFLVPRPIRRTNGGMGSIWSSYTPLEMEDLLSSSPFKNWHINQGWGWVYIWGKK